MHSIIICSRAHAISDSLSENIKKTVGCDYELIVIDNSENKYSIFEAYNLGIDRSKGDYLCFVHDDILFQTQDWGVVVLEIFNQNKKLGLLGVAGAKIKTKMPSAWWDCPETDKVLCLKQHLRDGSVVVWDKGFADKNVEKVAVIDGVCMIAKKDNRFRFQENSKGFHGYDLNISFEYINLGYEVMISNLIFIEHFSLGTINQNWYLSTLQMHQLYAKMLPLKTGKRIVAAKVEFANGVRFIKGLQYFKFKKEAFFLWLQLIVLKPVSRYHYRFLKQMLK